MDLLVARQEVSHRTERAVVLETQLHGLADTDADRRARLEVPAIVAARAFDRASQHWIQVDGYHAEFALEDRPELEGRIGLLVLVLRKRHFRAEAEQDRQFP